MADVITRFKLETSQYDSKIRSASQQISEYAKRAQLAGNEFQKFTQKNADAARSFGDIETSATNAKDKLKELVGAYNQAANAYNQLTKEQQQSDWGQALSQSLERLKVRITEAKNELYSVGQAEKQVASDGSMLGSAMDQLAGKFGLSAQTATALGATVAAVTLAVKVSKDAFMNYESGIDEWGRTVQAAESAYDVFLKTLNNGNWSNFFSNLQTAVQGARDLYDALDRLGSIKSNNQAAIALLQARIQELRLMKQAGKDVDAELKTAADQLRVLQSQGVNAGMRAGSMQVGNAIRNAYSTQQGASPLTNAMLKQATNALITRGQVAFDEYAQVARRLEAKATEERVAGPVSEFDVTVRKERYVNLNKLTKTEQQQYLLAKAITEGETKIAEGIAVYAQAVQEGASMAKENVKNNKYVLQGAGGGGGTGTTAATASVIPFSPVQGSLPYLQNQLKAAQTLQGLSPNISEYDSWAMVIEELTRQIQIFKGEYKEVISPEGPAAGSIDYQIQKVKELTEAWRAAADDSSRSVYASQLKEQQAILDQMQGKNTAVKAAEGKRNSVGGMMQQTVSALNSIAGGVENLGITIPEGLNKMLGTVQAVATILSGISALVTVIAAIQGTKAVPVIGWALSTGGTNVNGRVKRAAIGYTVPGNYMSNDQVPAMLNSGETVLTRSQTNNVASQLSGGALSNLRLSAVIEGTQIRMVLNNTTRQMGKGTYVTSR